MIYFCSIVVLLFLLTSAQPIEEKPVFQWTRDGVTKLGLITQDAVSRWSASWDPAAPINYTANGVSSTPDNKFLTQKMYQYNAADWISNWGSRLYLLNPEGDKYELFNLKNKEISFDVDVSTLPCGINSALYTVEMPEDGSPYGASYGGGYCDAQGTTVPDNGPVILACAEMDLWEANSLSTQFATHSCSKTGQFNTSEVVDTCDKKGCFINHYTTNQKFYGPGPSFAVDTTQVFTVVTQFFADSDKNLTDVRRFYLQKGKVIPSPTNVRYVYAPLDISTSYDSLSEEYCAAVQREPHRGISDSFEFGHALSFSLWAADDVGGMDWLNSPPYGPCTPNDASATRETVAEANKNAHVTWSNLKFGDINTTWEETKDDNTDSAFSARTALMLLLLAFAWIVYNL